MRLFVAIGALAWASLCPASTPADPVFPDLYPLLVNGILPKDLLEDWERPPETTDETSRQLLTLMRRATGYAHSPGRLVLHRQGTLKERGFDFALEAWQGPGQRRWQRSIRVLGRDYREVIAGQGAELHRWSAEPELERPAPVASPSSDIFFHDADPVGYLAEWEGLGHIFVYRGEEEVRGRKTYLLYGKLADGRLVWINIDAETFLPTRWSAKRRLGASAFREDRFILRFERIDGRLIEAEWEGAAEGRVARHVVWTETEQAATHDPALFTKPEFAEFWVKQGETR